MPKGNKKQRREAKRREKRKEARRREAVSPLKRLAEANGEVEYWKSPDFSTGQMQLFAYKSGARLSGFSCFLVDRGVVGLKDSWTRMNMSREDFIDMVQGTNRRGLPVVRASVEEVRRVVAGGLRWAYEHGMRLPVDWAKHVLLIGGVGDWKSADVSDFVKEFAGHPMDLRQRLIGETMESFLKRKDIQIILSNDAPFMDEESGNYVAGSDLEFDEEEYEEEYEEDGEEEDLESIEAGIPEEAITALASKLGPALILLRTETAAWLSARGKTPSPQLQEAWKAIIVSSMMSSAILPKGSRQEISDMNGELLVRLGRQFQARGNTEYVRALRQALDHFATDTQVMARAVEAAGLVKTGEGG